MALLWFAAGAATSAAVAVSADLLWSEPAPKTPKVPFLVLEEPTRLVSSSSGPLSETDKLKIVASETGNVLRNCGAKRFEITAVYPDHPASADLPITAENSSAFACVLSAGAQKGFSLNIELHSDRNAQTH
jgi:hypothetical protein